jgi:hypothetical protein
MDILTLLLIILIIIGIYLGFKATNKKNIKSEVVKKDELINAYKIEMHNTLEKYKNDKNTQTKEKIILLKRVNNELAMNIFFDKQESQKLLEELSKLD